MTKLMRVILIVTQTIKKLSITLFASVVVGFCLMCIAFLIPTNSICRNVKSSAPILSAETNYIRPIKCYSIYDNFTEAIYLNEAMVNGRDKGIIKSALCGYGYYGSRVENLQKAVNDVKRINHIGAYHRRFWNGYILPVKLALTVMDYSRIRQVNFILQIILFQWFVYLLVKKKLSFLIVPFVLMYVFLDPFALGNCLTFAGFYYCTIIPCIVMLLCNEKFYKHGWYEILFCVVGASAIYYNMNYFQLITFGVPMILYFVMNRPNTVQVMIRTFCIFFISWLFGYVGMMISKWILYAIFVDSNIFIEMYNNVIFRIGSTVEKAEITRMFAILKNFGSGLKYGVVWLLGEIVYLVYCYKTNFRSGSDGIKFQLSSIKIEFVLAIMFFILVICRYAIFANHVYIHSAFTYRLLVLPILAFNVLVATLIKRGAKKNE